MVQTLWHGSSIKDLKNSISVILSDNISILLIKKKKDLVHLVQVLWLDVSSLRLVQSHPSYIGDKVVRLSPPSQQF